MKLIEKPFILIRHGETLLNKKKLIGGRTDVPLTLKGRRDTELAASTLDSLLRTDWIIVSPLLRAKETADLLFPFQDKIIVNDIRERDWGVLEEMPQSMQTPYEETPLEGESWESFCMRVVNALNKILARYEHPVVIAHSGVFRVIKQLAYGSPYGNRVGNVEPYSICAGNGFKPWIFKKLENNKDV